MQMMSWTIRSLQVVIFQPRQLTENLSKSSYKSNQRILKGRNKHLLIEITKIPDFKLGKSTYLQSVWPRMILKKVR